jgi:hypothetical protein
MVARACAGGVSSFGALGPSLVRSTNARQNADGSCDTVLATALAAGVLLTFSGEHAATHRAIGALLRSQRTDGSWERHAFYGGPVEFWGSDELTTALALEALVRYRSAGLVNSAVP